MIDITVTSSTEMCVCVFQPVCVLADRQRAVISSLQYFKALVDRLALDKLVRDQSVVGGLLGGASSGVLEAVQTLVQLEPHLHNR